MMILSMTGALALLPVAQSPNTPYLYMIVLGYWLMNIAYCIRLKQYAILDVSIIAIGFVMRVLVGGVTTDIWISHWLVMLSYIGVLHHVHDVAGGYPTHGHSLCLSHQRLGACRPASLSAEHDCFRPQRFPHKEPC